jgi:hypothetical protein
VVQDCFTAEERDDFWKQLEATDAQCMSAQGAGFVQCSTAQRVAFFTELQAAAKKESDAPSGKQPFFNTLKGLTIGGYFTSEIGATQALAFDPIPGGWIPDMLIDANTKAWTPMF